MADLSKLKYPKGIYLGKAAHDSGSFASGQPVAIIQHYTAGGPSIDRLHGRNPDQVSVQFVVDRDGTVTQTGLCSQCCHHAGASTWRGLSGFNRLAIGIEQANYGYWRPGSGRLPQRRRARLGGSMPSTRAARGLVCFGSHIRSRRSRPTSTFADGFSPRFRPLDICSGMTTLRFTAAKWIQVRRSPCIASGSSYRRTARASRRSTGHLDRCAERSRASIPSRREDEVGCGGALPPRHACRGAEHRWRLVVRQGERRPRLGL
jgi:hypothetical protein